MSKKPLIILVGTYLPRRCGIATFTSDLAHSIQKDFQSKNQVQIIAIDHQERQYNYPSEVVMKVREERKEDYLQAASYINKLSNAYVCLQHEFGIFGGREGEYILSFVERLRRPLITTFHTILANPLRKQKEILKKLYLLSSQVVVMSYKACDLLKKAYQINPKKLIFIPHGAYCVKSFRKKRYKKLLGFNKRFILLTCGLLNPNKGIELVLEILPRLIQKIPHLLYVVVGTTHPKVKEKEGEKYRLFLIDYVQRHNLKNYVLFYDRFFEFKDLKKFLIAADLYIAPYKSKEQITSGTLAYALASGKVIISTPSWYAEELLGRERGVIVPFNDSQAIYQAILDLVYNPKKRKKLERETYKFAKSMDWQRVGKSYLNLFIATANNF